MKRPRDHGQAWQLKAHTHKNMWVLSLLRQGLKYEIEILEVHESSETLAEAERFYISYFRSIGCHLTNGTTGGEGCLALTELTRSRLSQAMLIRWASPEARAQQSRALIGKNVGKVRTPETIARQATAQRRRFADPAARMAHSRAEGGRAVIDEAGVMYDGVAQASAALGLDRNNLRRALKRGYNVGGHTFRYAEVLCSR